MTVLVGLLMRGSCRSRMKWSLRATWSYLFRRAGGEQKPDGLFLSPRRPQGRPVLCGHHRSGRQGHRQPGRGPGEVMEGVRGDGKVSNPPPGREMKTEGGTEGLLSVRHPGHERRISGYVQHRRCLKPATASRR